MTQTESKTKLLLAIPTAIVTGILNVFLFFLFMVLYGHVINPGHEESFYQEAANRFGPISSIVCGIPLMYLAGRWIGKRVGPNLAVTGGILVWLVYFVLDVTIVAASGVLMSVWPLIAVSFATKLAAVYLGARRSRTA
ncbi:MAG TPA: hypothetical protein VJV05_08960 [Pyrinomonadaceae bacterium]|nr:hypothetical protein [Pyrinomonadaceae bacterium]